MRVGDLVYAKWYCTTAMKNIVNIGKIREIKHHPQPYVVWFQDLGYSISFKEEELVLLEDYNGER